MDVSDFVSLILALLAVLSLVVAWRQWREVVRRRHVDMFWKIFDAYNSDELRDSRDAFFEIEEQLQLTRPSGRTPRITDHAELRDYSSKYWSEFYQGDPDHHRLDRLARARVRFYAQTGVLLRKGLVDEDLLFGLIGPPLDVDMRLLDVVIDANREGHQFPRMFEEVEYAYRDHLGGSSRPARCHATEPGPPSVSPSFAAGSTPANPPRRSRWLSLRPPGRGGRPRRRQDGHHNGNPEPVRSR